MTLEEVKQVYYINEEIKRWEKELNKIRNKSYVKGQQLTGLPRASGAGDKTAERAMLEREYEELIKDAQYRAIGARNHIMRYINTIDDSLMRQIIFYRHIALLPWSVVANEVGGDNTADSVRMLHNRFFAKDIKSKK